MLLLALLACPSAPPPAPPGEVLFLREALALPGDGGPLPGGRVLLPRAWAPGEEVELPTGAHARAPMQAECLPLFQLELGDVGPLIAAGGSPDTVVAFSPGEARWLAVGTLRGEVLLLDAWSGRVQARRRLPEASVRSLAWAADGQTLYLAEQSPDAFVRALDPADLSDRWTLRLADRVESSSPPAGEDLYGVYSLPAGYGLHALADGEVIVAASHGWGGFQGQRRNLAQVLRLGPDGQVRAAFPDAPAELTLMHPVLDPEERHVLVAVGHSSSRPAPEGAPVGGAWLLALPELRPVAAFQPEPLRPWFHEASVWQALGLGPGGAPVLLGLNDGRVRLHERAGGLRAEIGAGPPVMAGEVPVQVGVGWATIGAGLALYATTPSRIPWGAARPELRPPAPHPDHDLVAAFQLDGTRAWTWRGEQELQGLTLSPDQDELLLGAGARSSDRRMDLFGALVLDPRPEAPARLRAFCPTEGPVLFQHDLSADGRIAVVEAPVLDEAGLPRGAWRLTVLR